jgi:hypothetical protein
MSSVAEHSLLDEDGPEPRERFYRAATRLLGFVGITLMEKPPSFYRPREPREPGWYANVQNYAVGEADYDLSDADALEVVTGLSRDFAEAAQKSLAKTQVPEGESLDVGDVGDAARDADDVAPGKDH